ncbi:hypothetical protein ABI_45400 [Asticcacaulis biprosthecium C19]|uniref:Gylcosyl hydrolase 115 C-terminal domain-containing protein n=1 Tax=Asticcacaulis biprosthecium C19 TaxID=715226 RepID=F4QTP3_9CAUL|nr:glycosyl hydrolase 115 family protein [Asticcacaulis biprosthecium]EGF89193.1 hypothetical protein ABI_45400 [Asticcacaulis biprosthecium C19]
MKAIWLAAVVWLVPVAALACEGPVAVCKSKVDGFALISEGKPATVYVDANSAGPVLQVAQDFAADLERVSGVKPVIVNDLNGLSGPVVIIGQAGQPVIDGLVRDGKLDLKDISGIWEGYVQQVVTGPMPGLPAALVIAGSDPRGAVYGTYDISEKMGVSPWYWWADVPVKKQTDITVLAGARWDAPVVKYRGFFLNDEEPALGNWAREKFGGINAEFYAHVFELNLRLKGNFLWPAMWGKSLPDDDPKSLAMADRYGVVLSTSHHEPMARAHVEWQRQKDAGLMSGKWDYRSNAENLRTFWRGGIERRMCSSSASGSTKTMCHEQVITLGMRGDGDEPMTEGTATALLETIVADQRKIIGEVTGKPLTETPQVWALYKEVQDYYDHGMKAPEDVTLLFADDNWGQIRRLPKAGAGPRVGGYGVYYHFDYVGGPRNYKWLNTNQIEKVWQQMDLAYASGADRLWIVNVGDLKPMEFPLDFFLDMAWNPEAMDVNALSAYPVNWAEQQFGPELGYTISYLLTDSSKWLARRKPELLDAGVFAANPDFKVMTRDWQDMLAASKEVRAELGPEYDAAYFQLVHHPIAAAANVYELYNAVADNQALVAKGDAAGANTAADVAEQAFERDKAISADYHALLGGKWNHMMSQTHIGYDNWQQPDKDVMPVVKRLPVNGVVPKRQAVVADYSAVQVVEVPRHYGGRYTDEHGYVSIDAEFFTRAFSDIGGDVYWELVPDLGRTAGAVISLPQNAPPSDVTASSPMRVEYDVATLKDADAVLHLYLAPTLDTQGRGGLRIGVSIDGGVVQVLGFDLKPDAPDWNEAVKNNIHVLRASFPGLAAGAHTIKVFRIDGNVVLEKLVLDTGGLTPSYLGPVRSFQK